MDAAPVSGDAPVIVVLRGPIGAGKSTVAACLEFGTPRTVIVSRDTLRERHFHSQNLLSDQDEATISDLEMQECRRWIRSGYNVVIDATNLKRRYVERFQSAARDLGVDCVIVDVHARLETCIANVATRAHGGGRDVDEAVIRRVYDADPPETWYPPADFVVGEPPAPAAGGPHVRGQGLRAGASSEAVRPPPPMMQNASMTDIGAAGGRTE